MCRVGTAPYYVDDDCCGHYQNFRDMQLALAAGRGLHHRCESLADPYHQRRTYLTPVPDCRCCPTPSRDVYCDHYTAAEIYERRPYGPAPPVPARTPVLDVRGRQTPYIEGRRPITSPTRRRSKTPFSSAGDRRRCPDLDRCYSVFDDPRRAQFEAANPSTVASSGLRRRADTVGRAASLGHV